LSRALTAGSGSGTVGTIQLDQGQGTLTLQATKIPGASVMDFRLLILERVD
jgi:hypothetical protein